MRVTDLNDHQFCEWLEKLGTGQLTNVHGFGDDIIEIDKKFIVNDSLINHIFPNISVDNIEQHIDSAILTPLNDSCININNEIMQRLDTPFVKYTSVDSLESNDDDEIQNYPVEFLNTITMSGMPPHILKLKIGAIGKYFSVIYSTTRTIKKYNTCLRNVATKFQSEKRTMQWEPFHYSWVGDSSH